MSSATQSRALGGLVATTYIFIPRAAKARGALLLWLAIAFAHGL
jgi:hypothetical protein